MRWLFLFVLIVNIAYVAWEFGRPVDEVHNSKKNKNVPPIMLLSELRQVEKPVEQAVVEVEEALEVQQPAAQVETIVEPEQADTEQVLTEPVVTSAVEVETCFTLGPFRKLEKLRVFTRAIKDYVVDASFRSREEQEQSMFWVYLLPRADFDKAKALGVRLEKMKIRDYYIINQGDQKNGISLGHFKEKDRAYNYADSIKKLGFKPTVEPVFRTYTVYWLDYTVLAGKNIPANTFTEHLDSNINRLDRPCF